jgi:hypothetical protein
MRRWIAFTGVFTMGILLVGVPAIADAATTPNIACFVERPPHVYRLSATAEYEEGPIGHGIRTWHSFRFMVHGGSLGENHNNVNISLSEFGTVMYSYNSPDNLVFNRWYQVNLNPPVRTSRPSSDHVEIEAIFDYAGGADPRCTGTTDLP